MRVFLSFSPLYAVFELYIISLSCLFAEDSGLGILAKGGYCLRVLTSVRSVRVLDTEDFEADFCKLKVILLSFRF
jgi:hypothetical protein